MLMLQIHSPISVFTVMDRNATLVPLEAIFGEFASNQGKLSQMVNFQKSGWFENMVTRINVLVFIQSIQ